MERRRVQLSCQVLNSFVRFTTDIPTSHNSPYSSDCSAWLDNGLVESCAGLEDKKDKKS